MFNGTEVAFSQSLTDLLLGLILLPMILALCLQKTNHRALRRRWNVFFAFLSAASIFGFIAHFCCRTPESFRTIWIILYPLMFEAVNAFVLLAVELVTHGARPSRRDSVILHLVALVACVAVLSIWFTYSNALDIRIFTGYALVVALPAFALIGIAAIREKRRCLQIILAALIPLLPAAYVQIKRETAIRLIWEFDHNGIAHLCIIASLFVLFFAARCSLKETLSENGGHSDAAKKETADVQL